jgi:hypothetical protein
MTMGMVSSAATAITFCQLSALSCVPHIHSRSSQVQLETDELATSLPTPDLLDRGIVQGIHGKKSNQASWKLRNLFRGKLIFASR